MEQPEILKAETLKTVLQKCSQNGCQAVVSYLSRGKWRMTKVVFGPVTNKTIHLQINDPQITSPVDLQSDQPVGISFSDDNNKCIFETVVIGTDTQNEEYPAGCIVIAMPDRMEKMRRRTYSRALVPDTLKVAVNLWHRGYMYDSDDKPPAENCWQGSLVNIGAGGMQISLPEDKQDSFKAGQVLGIQFTPMSYQQPIIVEGEVKHVAEAVNDGRIFIGVEFIGLEATGEGREKLKRIVNTVDTYHEKAGSPDEENVPAAANKAKNALQEAEGLIGESVSN